MSKTIRMRVLIADEMKWSGRLDVVGITIPVPVTFDFYEPDEASDLLGGGGWGSVRTIGEASDFQVVGARLTALLEIDGSELPHNRPLSVGVQYTAKYTRSSDVTRVELHGVSMGYQGKMPLPLKPLDPDT